LAQVYTSHQHDAQIKMSQQGVQQYRDVTHRALDFPRPELTKFSIYSEELEEISLRALTQWFIAAPTTLIVSQ
jgi:hypothetical protein